MAIRLKITGSQYGHCTVYNLNSSLYYAMRENTYQNQYGSVKAYTWIYMSPLLRPVL
ncbi:hypothetical protein SAMD00079811_61200 [Scytonema sp. HK-05]|nr:hypothetical protein SAMD00079811_61200 [Scytonema sp. HK-05]